jgi:peptidoglycan-associated lipoprotein
MNTRREMLFVAAAVSLFAAGCSTGKTAENKPEVQTAQPPAGSPSVPSPAAANASAANGYFVANENLKPVYFELSQSRLNETAMATIKENAVWLDQNPPLLLEIVGYADSRGSSKRNQTLAERRATHVRDAYASLGIPKERFTLTALGAEAQDCKEMSETCLQQSRRTETRIENKTLVSK